MWPELNRLARGSLIYGIGSVFQRFLGLLLLPFFTRVLSPQEYGVMALLGLVTVAVVGLFNLGTGSSMGVLYFEREDIGDRHKVIWSTALLLAAWDFQARPMLQVLPAGVVLATSETWRHLHMGYFHRAAAYLPIRACSSHRPVMVGRRWALASTGQMPGSAWPAGLQVGSLPTRCLAGPAA